MDTRELIERVRAACNGHPHAKIAWPHRILHEAAAALSSQAAEIERLREALRRISAFPETQNDGTSSYSVGYAFDVVQRIAATALIPKPNKEA